MFHQARDALALSLGRRYSGDHLGGRVYCRSCRVAADVILADIPGWRLTTDVAQNELVERWAHA
jgi:hypothetical protein